MATAPKESRKVLEGVFAINKPQWSSSAGVLRDLQTHFSSSPLFAPWLESQRRAMYLSNSKPRHIANLKVKLGHGGTLDPMATGVLIVGVGKGTKHLGSFLDCTKSYECVVLFGAATDSYDAVGKVVGKASFEHVTKDLVEEKLSLFQGKIMQRPSVFSALKVDGKKMYEYAREGKDIPEVAARPVEVLELELVEWLEPASHDFTWPKEQVDGAEMQGAEKLLGIRKEDAKVHAKTAARRGTKRSRTLEDDSVEGAGAQPKRPRTDSEPAMSGALPAEDAIGDAEGTVAIEEPAQKTTTALVVEPASPTKDEKPAETAQNATVLDAAEPSAEESRGGHANGTTSPSIAQSQSEPRPPAARLRMTVTSGFYVRSLCHDLGLACSSLGIMSSLIRSRQGEHELGENVVEWSDIEAGPEAWEPQVQKYLEEFMDKEGWEAEDLEDDEAWRARKREVVEQRKEDDRERSYKGGGGGKGTWNGKGKGGRSYYDKKMSGGRNGEQRSRREERSD